MILTKEELLILRIIKFLKKSYEIKEDKDSIYFIDLSDRCLYSIEKQIRNFKIFNEYNYHCDKWISCLNFNYDDMEEEEYINICYKMFPNFLETKHLDSICNEDGLFNIYFYSDDHEEDSRLIYIDKTMYIKIEEYLNIEKESQELKEIMQQDIDKSLTTNTTKRGRL